MCRDSTVLSSQRPAAKSKPVRKDDSENNSANEMPIANPDYFVEQEARKKEAREQEARKHEDDEYEEEDDARICFFIARLSDMLTFCLLSPSCSTQTSCACQYFCGCCCRHQAGKD